MDKIKVLQVPIRNSKGGITHYAMNNWSYIDHSKFQFDYVTFSKTLDFEDEITSSGCRVHYISCYAEENESQFIAEMNQVLSQGYDAVHIHTSYWKSFLIERLALQHGIPKIIVHAHSTQIDEHDDLKRAAAQKVHETKKAELQPDMATDFWACSQLAADWLFGPQIPRERIKILHNAIDVSKFEYNPAVRAQCRKRLGLDDKFVIGHVGRMVYQKNHEFLIDMFYELSKRIGNAALLLAGDGPLRADILAQVHALRLDDRVHFLGNRDDVAQLYQAMDVFCLPSRFEGLGLVLIEAQAAGLPCIASTAVPVEAKATDLLALLPLHTSAWCDRLEQLSQGYARKHTGEALSQANYSLAEEIKTLEHYYSAKPT